MTTISNRRNWYLFYTGGLFTTGGLGWGLRQAYTEDPKAAMLSYLTGSAGLCLFNMAVIPRSGKKAAEASGPNWAMMISGALISGAGFGYCLSFTLKENPKSTIMAYTVGSLGYIMANAAVYNLCRENEEEVKANEEIHDSTNISHARIHYANKQCELCKFFVEKAIRERKEAEKRQGLSAIGYSLWNSIKKFCPLTGRAKDKDYLFVKKNTLLRNLERETSKTCRDEHNPRKPANRNSSSCTNRIQEPIHLNKDSIEVTESPNANSKPIIVSKRFPGEKSTQMEYPLAIEGIQRQEVYLASSNQTVEEYKMVMEDQFGDEVQGSAVSVFKTESQLLVEEPTENQQFQIEDKP